MPAPALLALLPTELLPAQLGPNSQIGTFKSKLPSPAPLFSCPARHESLVWSRVLVGSLDAWSGLCSKLIMAEFHFVWEVSLDENSVNSEG
eukprot:gene9544-10548_t